MKIAFLTPEYPHTNTGSAGGIGTSIKNLALALSQQGHHVKVLVYGQNSDNCFLDQAIEINQIKNVKFKGLSWFLTRKKIEKVINRLYKNHEIEIVEAPDWTGITSFIKPKKCPIIIKLHGSDTYFCHLDQRKVKWHNKFHEKRALQLADARSSVSLYTANTTNAVFGINKPFCIIPNGIDTALFSLQNINLNKDATILYFGTLIRKKGVLELPYIFNEIYEIMPEAKLILIGKDASDVISGNQSTWQMMQPLFNKNSFQNVTYLGAVPYDKMQEQIAAATVCVFPTFAEALPVSWLEAMAMHKAIVASDIGWASEIISDSKDGFLESPKSHKEFADKLLLLLKNDSLRNEIAIAARATIINRFSIVKVAQLNVDFYEKVIFELNKNN